MKRLLAIILGVEALVCILFFAFGNTFENAFVPFFAFPFEQIGLGLRNLSLSGPGGNVLSIILYCTFSLLPIAYFLYRIYKGSKHVEDGLLVLISILLFTITYLMINPAYIASHFSPYFAPIEFINVNKAFLGIIIYTVIVGYLIFRMLRVLKEGKTFILLRYLKILLFVTCMVLIYSIFGTGLGSLTSSFQELRLGNTDQNQNLNISYIFLILQHIVKVLPLVLEIVIILLGLDLVTSFEGDQYSNEIIIHAKKIGQVSRYSIVIIMLSQIVVNLLQFVLGSLVRTSHYTLSVPILSIIFVLGAILFANYLEQTKELKEDSDMII